MNVKWKSAGEKLNLKSENKDYDWSFDLLLIYWSDIDLILIWYWSILIGNVRFFFQSLILKNLYSWYWKKTCSILLIRIDQDCFFSLSDPQGYLHFFLQNLRNPVFFLNVFACFCNGFLQGTAIYTFVAVKPFQSIMFNHVSNSLISPNLRKYRSLQYFLQFFHVPLPLANSTIYAKYPFKTLFFTVFLQCSPAKTW